MQFFFHRALNQSGSLLIAAALIELFPGIALIDRRLTPQGFSVRFHSENFLSPQIEELVNRKLRQIIKEKREIRVSCMVPANAREFLRARGLGSRSFPDIRGQFAEVAQIGDFVDLSEGPHCAHSGELSIYKFLPLVSEGEGIYCLDGSFFPTKEAMKFFSKEMRSYAQTNALALGTARGFWHLVRDELVWEEKGCRLLDDFGQKCTEELFQGCRQIGMSRQMTLSAVRSFYQGELITQKNLCDPAPLVIKENFYSHFVLKEVAFSGSLEGEWISSLQRIRKTLNILAFEPSLLFQGRALLGQKALEKEWGSIEKEEGELSPLLFVTGKDRLGRRLSLFRGEWDRRGFVLRGHLGVLFALALERGTIDLLHN
ncbi:MAG: hypothetical protein KGI80_02255 [Verrucomicrobiota bacterium]|nr:hypothetical protein [Verrucomicrobiota bacterium]